MKMRSRRISFSTLATCFPLAVAIAFFALQLRALYTVPVYDSVRWGGDETWLMREFGNQIEHGVMSYPENFGGPQRTDGVLAGSMWVDALIYGFPGNILFPAHDYVSVGRTVTAILALLLLFSIYFVSRRLGILPLLAALTVLLVVACRGFVWASHSARYDLLTGLTLVWYCYLLSRQKNPSRGRMVLLGLIGALTICFSRHMLMLGLAASLAFLIELRVWKRRELFWSWIAGSAIGAAALSLAYAAGAHEFSLFGRGGSDGSYSFVLNQIPILRPFSRNVQVSNLMERLHLFELDAPGMLIVVGAAILLGLIYLFSNRRRMSRLAPEFCGARSFWFLATLFCTIAWLLTEGSRPYYLYHIVPMLAIASALALQKLPRRQSFGSVISAGVMIVAIAVAAQRAVPSNILGPAIERDQSRATAKFLNEVPRKSRILLDVAGLDRALPDTAQVVLTLDMFQPPHEVNALVQKLLSSKIDYVILRSSPVETPFEPGRALLPHVLDSIGTLRDTALGFFYDDGRSYDASISELQRQGLDTLKFYSVP